jgi:hypothetical protein
MGIDAADLSGLLRLKQGGGKEKAGGESAHPSSSHKKHRHGKSCRLRFVEIAYTTA